jgi:UDP-N-acetylglucosamine/UDP-N-acetylgalactosamine diphosphorylase
MLSIPQDLRQRLHQFEQDHVLAFWEQLGPSQREGLLMQLRSLDLEQLRQLYARRDKSDAVPPPEQIGPVPVIPHDSPDNPARKALGETAIRQGKLAVLVVAGGQGTRLGFDHPKGMYPVGPVSKRSLFQVHAEKVLATSRRYGARVPFLVMTSPATHQETLDFFLRHTYFGLPAAEVFFFCQGTMPALDRTTGRLLMEAPERLFLGPDGHGGTLTALATSGLLAQMRERGIEHLFYFQVDNPLVKVADPVFLGHHLAARAEVSSKTIAKRSPGEKVGVFGTVAGRCSMIEYSDLPEALARQTDEHGRLVLWAGNPAIHLFDLAFLDRMTRDPEGLPFHIAKKKVPHIDASGKPVEPQTENALKFERFIFDVLPRAELWTVVETKRESEFSPLKNASGEDSEATVERDMVAQAVDWITRAGGAVARKPDGSPVVAVEVGALYALDAEEMAQKLPPGTRIEAPEYFGPTQGR